jgi:hypothetical protein
MKLGSAMRQLNSKKLAYFKITRPDCIFVENLLRCTLISEQIRRNLLALLLMHAPASAQT